MPTVIATPGAANANSYITRAEGTTFADERLQASRWGSADDADKDRALIQATARLDLQKFVGWKTTTEQALKWPRTDTFDEDSEEYETDDVPAFLKRATFETALWLLNENAGSTDPFAPTGLEPFNRANAGPLSVEVDKSYSPGQLPDNVRRMISHVLESGGFSGSAVMAELERS